MFRSEAFAQGDRLSSKRGGRQPFIPVSESLEMRQLLAIDLTEFSQVATGVAYEATAEVELSSDVSPEDLISLRVDRTGDLVTVVTVFGPDGESIATNTADENGDSVVLNAIRPSQSGTHRFEFEAVENTTGGFRLDVLLNGLFEQETPETLGNNTLTDAENVNSGLKPYGSAEKEVSTTRQGEPTSVLNRLSPSTHPRRESWRHRLKTAKTCPLDHSLIKSRLTKTSEFRNETLSFCKVRQAARLI